MKALLVFALSLLWMNPAVAESGLQQQLAAIVSLSGSFEQRVLDDSGVELEVSNGRFKVLQPGYFYWAIDNPDAQLLIANGKTLVHYDAELETATERGLDEQQSSSPLAIFADGGAGLEAHYEVSVTDGGGYLLKPRVSDGSFVEVELRLNADVPGSMRVLDALGNTTQIEFSEVLLNPPLEPAEFTFVPPDGVDFYRYEQ
ncbi:outer membrane lipoprotein chaperone LolA [Halieaceae bacterium IMCC14734]|uniref:Outer-membrane lipoprotein carrier protein n=1 Tax=Candidatus Litorirhabdus singularis TaxID=2518993 RepID=A0ABT3TIR5_9GAMM|nr:outer membrane lipoprotein chaperone LolA [Candidatus Litorirhabdus singularis]MCX2981242.1 outer membrane lipoprotein chaperone LolA [Candidatus Litorirhabdus singularis]